MHSHTAPHRLTTLVLIIAAAIAAPCARTQDGQPMDIAQMLQQLRQLREQTATKTKADKQKAIQQVTAIAASGESAVVAWENAEMATHFDGVSREASAFKTWRDTEGATLKEGAARNAARLYFEWLALTLQRSAGTSVKDLLPALMNYTKQLLADQAIVDSIDDVIDREKERTDGKHGVVRKSNVGDVKKMHDSILGKPLAGSMGVQWMKLDEWVNIDKWEGTPGNYDGIYEKTILPELRAQRDPRAIEYWDLKIKT